MDARYIKLKSFEGTPRTRTPKTKSMADEIPRQALTSIENKVEEAKETPVETAIEKPAKAQEEPAAVASCPFRIKQTVHVKSRTYPGINKPGGVGRVTKINADGTVNVKYILGGSERNLTLDLVTAHDTNAKHVREKKKREI